MLSNVLCIRRLGLQHWQKISNYMKNFTESRNDESYDELWLVEHFPIFTYGQSSKFDKLSTIKSIPIVKSNRGGKVTYHGPGQQLIYILIDIRRRGISIRKLITSLENTIITTLSHFGIKSYSDINAPGVYINKKKFLQLD